MLCPHISKILLLTTLAATLTATPAATAQESWSWKLYDLRDLIGLIPPTMSVKEEPSHIAQMRPYTTTEQTAPKPDKEILDKLMDKLCTVLAVDGTRLFAGVYGIQAEDIQHALLLRTLEEIRALYAERYEVEIAWFTAAADQAPAVGDVATPVNPMHLHRLVATRRTPTPLEVITQYAYVSDLQAVVATGAVAHDPEIETAEGGLRASILIGAGQEKEGATTIQIVGELRRVVMGKMSGPLTGTSTGSAGSSETSSMQLELPIVSVRSVRSDIHIEYGKPTVLGVLDGFDDGQCFVLAASVRRLDG